MAAAALTTAAANLSGHGPLHRVDEIYRTVPPENLVAAGAERDPDPARRLASMVARYHTGASVLFGWLRPAAGSPVTVLTTGGSTVTSGGGAERSTVLSFPPGTRGTALPDDALDRQLAALPAWVAVTVIADGLLSDGSGADGVRNADGARPGLADTLLGVWAGAFGWLVLAEPLPAAEVATETARIAALERDARTRTSPEYVVRAARLDHRHRELRAGESSGLWRLRIVAGGADPQSARAVAGLLCAASDLTDLPYRIAPTGPAGDLGTVFAADPTVVGSPLVAALARPPSVEIPGVRLVPRSTFDVTPETGGRSGVELGPVLDRDGRPAGPLRIPVDSLNRHTFVCGATGGGKSQTVRHLLEQATAAGLPWLVIEPAKAEYRRMAARIPGTEVIVVRPGDPDAPPVGFNPLAPAPGFPLQTHVDLVRALFVAAFAADEPFPQVLAAALNRCYERLGWDLTLGEPVRAGLAPRHPTLTDLQATATEVVEAIGYGREITDNVRGFIDVRIGSLRVGTTGRFFEGGHRLDFGRLLRGNVVLEIEDVGDDRDKAFLMGAVLIQLVEHLRVRERTGPPVRGLRHLTVIEEAHRLLRRPDTPGPAAHAVEMFASLLAEVRAYGEGLVIAEQIPAKLIPDVIKNTAVKIVHRLPARDDREVVGATMNLTPEQSRYLVTLPPGTGAVFADGMDGPVLSAVPDGSAREDAVTTAPVVTAARLVSAPAAGCPADCAADPCPLRRMTGARRLLSDDRRLTIWAELAVVGHLVGMPVPRPAAGFVAALRGADARLLDCALGQAVAAAVDVRSTGLAASHSPDAFVRHVVADLRTGRCVDHPRAWLASCFRWNPVRVALQDRLARDPSAARHPDSAAWAAAYGREVPGETCEQQLAVVRSWCVDLLSDPAGVHAVLFGSGRTAAIETAVGVTRHAPGWRPALRRALAGFTVTRKWPEAFLVVPR